MANVTTNPPWKDYPDTSTLITANALNNIEEALNEASAGASVLGGLTDLESERGLRAMRVALESGTARIVAMGDSKTEGAGVSNVSERWLNVLQDNLRAMYSTADTGLGYLPAYYATFYGFPTAPVITGTHTEIDNSGGLGNRTVELALGATITWTVPAWTSGVTMPLHYMRFAGGGSIEVVTDGVVRATIATAGAEASLVSNVSIPAGATSIMIRPKAGTAPVRVSGIVHRTSTSGIIVYDGAHSGAIAADYTGGRGSNPQSDELHWQAVTAVNPHGIIMAFGANDQSDPPGGRTVEQWQDDIGDLFTRAKAAAPSAGLVLLVGAQRTEEVGDPTRIRAFEQAAREAVSARPDSTILYESRLWAPIIGEDYTDGDGVWLSDTVHTNALGNQAIARYLSGYLDPAVAASVGEVTGTYYDFDGNQTPFGPGQAQSIAKAVNTVSSSLVVFKFVLDGKASTDHSSTHAIGGTDALTPADIGAAVEPTLIGTTVDLNDTALLDRVVYTAGAGGGWATKHYPAGVAGVVSTYRLNATDSHAVQTMVSRESAPRMWTRSMTSGSWSGWTEIGGAELPAAYGNVDLNTLTRGTRRFSTGAFTNGPAGMSAGMVETTAITNADNYLLQVATEWTYPDRPGRIWTRRKSGSSWGAWGLIGPIEVPPESGVGNASAYKVVAVPLNGGQTSTSNASTTMTVRQVIDLKAPFGRARLRFRNIDTRSGSAKTTTATVSDIYVGPHIGSGAASSLTKVASGFTVAADEVASAWFPVDHDGTSELLITYTVTAAVGQMFTNYGDIWTKNSTAAHTETAPTGLYRTYTTPLAVTMDVQTAPTTPVLAVAGDSNSIGVGSSGIRDAWGWRLARRLEALPQLLGSSGDTVAASRDFTAYKWARVTGDGRAQADALLWALGQNDLGAGTTSTAIQAMLAEDIPKARALIAPSGVHAITYMPRDDHNPTSAFEVQRRLLNTALKSRPFGLLDTHDIVPVVSTDDETIRPEYKGGGGGTDPVHLNALGFQAVADSITDPVLPAPITPADIGAPDTAQVSGTVGSGESVIPFGPGQMFSTAAAIQFVYAVAENANILANGAAPASRFLTGTGSPEGVTAAPIGTTYTDTATGNEWHKMSGTGVTGWRGPIVLADDPRIRDTGWVPLNTYGATSNWLTLDPAWEWTTTGGSSIRVRRTGNQVTLRVVGNLRCTAPANTETELFVEDFPSGYRMTYEMVPLAPRTAGAGLAQIGAGMSSGTRLRVLTTASPFTFGYTQALWTTDNSFPA